MALAETVPDLLAPIFLLGGIARQIVAKQAAGACAAPAVSPDGTRVAFVVNQQHVAVAPIDGSILRHAHDFRRERLGPLEDEPLRLPKRE